MNFRKIVILPILSLLVLLYSFSMAEQPVNIPKQIDVLVKENFDSLLNYKFLNSKHQGLALQIGQTLIELIGSNNSASLEDILADRYRVESKLAIWQAAAFVNNEFENLNYRMLQQIKLEILADVCFGSASNLVSTKSINKKIKSFISKKLYSKYRKLFELDLFSSNLIKDYFSFVDSYLKNGSSFNFALDEDKLDNLIRYFYAEKQELEVKLKNLNDISFAKKLFEIRQIKKLKNRIKMIELFIQNLLKIKVGYLYNKGMEIDFDKAFISSDSSKKMLVIKHYILLTKSNFKNFMQDEKTSKLFNAYLDLVIFSLNNPNALEQPLFIYNFFQLYSDLNDLKEKNKGILPFVSFLGNGTLLNVIDEMQEILNIILKNINDKMGTGPGWLKKMLLGKVEIPKEVIDFGFKVFEERVLSKI